MNQKQQIVKQEKHRDGTNNIVSTIEYESVLEKPQITVSLYRRKYNDVYDMEYEKVNLQEYVTNTLNAITEGQGANFEKEYLVTNTPKSTQDFLLTLKTELKTGTYKLVYKLYDGNNYVGEDYEYIVIK